jgi:crossover junction endodeoxyribonuclease RuvC
MGPRLQEIMPADCCLGVDPGLCRTGYAVLQRGIKGPILREGGVIRSTPKLSLAERVLEIGQGLLEVLKEFQPQVMAIEQVFSSGEFPKTAILMAHARGAILFAAAQSGVSVVDYAPRQIKRMLTGSGKASKEQIQHAVKNELGLTDVLKPNDVADAFAVALCHYHFSRSFPYREVG